MSHLAVLAAVAAPASDKLTGLNALFAPIAKPIAEILAGFYAIVPDFGVAILILSVVWMVIIAPLTLKSTRSMLAMQKLQPEMKKLKEIHANDRVAFAQATQELYREREVSPFGSCLPSLLPLPVFFALFEVIDGLSNTVLVNGLRVASPRFLTKNTEMYKAIVAAHGHLNAFGMDLSKNALSSHSSLLAAIPYFVILIIMMGAQYMQTAQMMKRNPSANANPQMKLMKFLPLILGVVLIRFPAGVILYYATSAVCRIAQQTLMYRYDPKVLALVAEEVIEVEALTHDFEAREASGRRGRSRRGSPPPAGRQGAPPSPQAPQSRFQELLNRRVEQESAPSRSNGSTGTKGGPTPKRVPSGSPNPAAPGAGRSRRGSVPEALPRSGRAAAKPGAPATAKSRPTSGGSASTNGRSSQTPSAGHATGNGSGAAAPRPQHAGGSSSRARKRRRR